MPSDAVGLQEFDIRMDTAEFLGDGAIRLAHQHRTLVFQRSVHRNGAKGGRLDDASHVGRLFDPGVEQVLDQRGEHAHDQAKHHAHGQIQGGLRRRLGQRGARLLHNGDLHRRRVAGVQIALDHCFQRLRHGVGDVGGLLRITIHHGDVHERGVGRIGDGDLVGEVVDGLIQAKIVDNRLEHLLGGGQRRIRGDLVRDVGTAGGLLADAFPILGSVIGGHGLGRRRILRRRQERIRAHTRNHNYESDNHGEQVLANDFQQIHEGDAVIRFLNYPRGSDGMLNISALCRSH